MTFLPFPGALICVDTLWCLCQGTMGWRGRATVVKKKEERNAVGDFDRLISFGFIRLSPQTVPVTAVFLLGWRWT